MKGYKVFPINMSDAMSKKVKAAAEKAGMPMYVFISIAINEKLEREGNNNAKSDT